MKKSRWLTIGALLLATTPLLRSQVRGGIRFGPSHAASGYRMHGAGPYGQPYSPLVLGSPYFYGDDFYAAPAAQPTAPQFVVLQPAPSVEAAKEPPRPEPLMIELQGDRYVRIGEATAKGSTDLSSADSAIPAKQIVKQADATAEPLPPAVLVYRDGHQEQVRDYAIADGVLYARGDYWVDGYWNKKVQLASLNLPATVQASQKNGAKFVLPSSPNEVVTRP